jgi:hypothetical protein
MTPIILPDDQTVADMNGPLHYWGPAPATPRRLHPSDDLLLRRLRARLRASGGDPSGVIPALASVLAISVPSSGAA